MADNQHSYQSGRIKRTGTENARQAARPPEQQAPAQPPQAPRQPYRQSISQMTGAPAGSGGILPVSPAQQSAPRRRDDLFAQPANAGGRASVRPAGKRRSRALIIVAVVLAALLLAMVGVFAYLKGVFDPGAFGISKDYIPKEYSKHDSVNVLIVGIDYEDGREYADGLGMTDMILYANFDLVNNKLNMLQIPRDSYVGEDVPTGGTGKINAALLSGADKRNPINNLVKVIEEQYKLPVDHYVAMDMDALKTIVNTFGGLRVYVPRTMDFAGSHLDEGWQWLDGDACEFFVRNRSGAGFERADIDRLDNQRHFYSALFRRFLNLTPTDIVHLLPVFEHYCNTDIKLNDIFDLCVSALKLNAENVLFCKIPGATGDGLDPTGAGRSLYIVDKYGRGTPEDPGAAALLNQYFRTYTDPVPAEELGLPDIHIPEGYTLYPPNVQVMTDVQAPEGGADVDVEPSYAA